MGYIEELRKLIGHRPIFMVGATVLLTDPQDRLLLMLRTDNGLWGVAGGALEPDETIEEAVRRETLEETGLQIKDLALFGVYSGPDLFYRYPNGDEVYNVSIVFTGQPDGGQPVIDPAEHSQMQYFELDRLPDQISPPIVRILADFKKSRPSPAYE
jgi:8-oxo-dGTP pyrophosphatase MutT (NUDIX family)